MNAAPPLTERPNDGNGRSTPIELVRRREETPEPPVYRPPPPPEWEPRPILRNPTPPPGPFDALDFLPIEEIRFGAIGWIVIYIAFSIHKDLAPTTTVSGVAARSAGAVFVLYLVFKLRAS